jgi:hypothetical protein
VHISHQGETLNSSSLFKIAPDFSDNHWGTGESIIDPNNDNITIYILREVKQSGIFKWQDITDETCGLRENKSKYKSYGLECILYRYIRTK